MTKKITCGILFFVYQRKRSNIVRRVGTGFADKRFAFVFANFGVRIPHYSVTVIGGRRRCGVP